MTDSNVAQPEPSKRKRGRPPGSTADKRRKLLHTQEESDSDQPSSETAPVHSVRPSQSSQKLLQKYQDALKAYEKTNFNSHTHHILRRVAAEPILHCKSQQEPVLQQLMDVAKKVMITELEIAAWALHLGRSAIAEVDMPLHTALLVSAFCVKSAMGAEVAHVQSFLEKQQSAFSKSVETWEKLHPKETFSFTFHEVNAKWKQLKRAISEDDLPVINYNYYVDDILQAGITPVDQFTSADSLALWHQPMLDVQEIQQTRPIKPVPTSMSVYEPVFAKECEEFAFAPMPWFDQVPLSPGLLFYNFPTPPPSALMHPMDENFEAQFRP